MTGGHISITMPHNGRTIIHYQLLNFKGGGNPKPITYSRFKLYITTASIYNRKRRCRPNKTTLPNGQYIGITIAIEFIIVLQHLQ
jgi:hypothetical protein